MRDKPVLTRLQNWVCSPPRRSAVKGILMHAKQTLLRWLAAAFLGAAGCYSTPNLKPTLKEEYMIPPADDARFSSPPTFPKETMDYGKFSTEAPPKQNSTMSDKMNGDFGSNRAGRRNY